MAPGYLLSIITVCRNRSTDLKLTLESIVGNKSSEIEYIVIDGGSTDGSLELLQSYSSIVDTLISEPDKGIYDAMNKGLAVASGVWCLFLNAGDILFALPLHCLSELSNSTVLAAFPVQLSNSKVFVPSYNWELYIRNTLHHQGLFYRRMVGLRFDIKYRVFADYHLNLLVRQLRYQVAVFTSPVVAYHVLDGVSNNKGSNREFFTIIRHTAGFYYVLVAYVFAKWRGLRQRLI
jgi:glycosyltransferase involved in cell wall biosynthesis